MNIETLDTVALIVYLLCAFTSLICATLLLRGYRTSHTRLLLWSGLCFVGFFLNAVAVIIDLKIEPAADLSIWRLLASLAGLSCLIYGMVWDSER